MKSRTNNDFWLYKKPIAHRGLFSNENGIPENTEISYEEAIKAGYPIEMDIQMSADNKLFCFHDDNTKRLCGVDKDIRDMTEDEIRSLRPLDLSFKILTFKEFLSLVNGRVPLLIEIKNQKRKGIEELVLNDLKDYKGDYVIQSFNPFIMQRINKLNGSIISGILMQHYSKSMSFLLRFYLNHMLFRFKTKIDFVNIRIEDLEKYKKICKKYPVIAWTARDDKQFDFCKKYARNVVFEQTFTKLNDLFD